MNLLDLPIEDRSQSLRNTWPPPLDKSLTGNGGVTYAEGERTAVEITVLITRAVNGHCDPLDPELPVDAATIEGRKKSQKIITLMRYSWHNTSGEVTEVFLKLQKTLCQASLDRVKDLTFEDLVECKAMAKGLWSRCELLAWSDKPCEVHGADSQVNEPDVTSIWAMNGQPDIQEKLAYRSLLKWNWDGKMQLDEFLTSRARPGWLSHDDTIQHRCIRAWPRCLRIRYDPRDLEGAPRFTDLARIRLTVGEDKKLMMYRILAVVRLGDDGGFNTFVRIYDSDCRDSRPMATQALSLPYVNNKWELGQSGSRYMLYYLKYDTDQAPNLPPKEVVSHPWLKVENIRLINAMHNERFGGKRPEPLPYRGIRPDSLVASSMGRFQATPSDQNSSGSKGSQVKGDGPRKELQKRMLDDGLDLKLYYEADRSPFTRVSFHWTDLYLGACVIHEPARVISASC